MVGATDDERKRLITRPGSSVKPCDFFRQAPNKIRGLADAGDPPSRHFHGGHVSIGKPPMDRVRKKKRRKRKKEREREEREERKGEGGRGREGEEGACWAWQLLLLAGRLLPALFCASVHLFAAFACRAPSKFSKTRFPFSLAQASPSYEAKSPRPAAPSGARQSRRRLRPFGHPLLLFHGPLLLHEASTSVSRRPYPAISHSPTKDQ